MREYYDLLRSTSRTFAVGIEALPRGLRDSVTLAYLVLRVADYFEDSPTLAPSEKRRLLDGWARLLDGAQGAEAGIEAAELASAVASADAALPDRRAALEAEGILAGLRAVPPVPQEIIRRHTAATTRGMAHWIGRGDDFPDEAALDAYMFEVAGRVGLLLTDLFLAHDPPLAAKREELEAVAVTFGLGLQTVNVIRGLHEDPHRGWTYVPRDVLGNAAEPRDLRHLSSAEKERILAFLVRKAARHVADGFQYCQALPRLARGIRIFCIVPALLASRTAEASLEDLEVFDTPVKVSRRDVRRIILETRLRFYSNRWLEGERERVLALAAHRGQAARPTPQAPPSR